MASRRFGPYTVETSNEDKVLFDRDGITKGELIEHYLAVADVALPHLRDRPLTVQRFPDGIDADGFFQKNVPDYFPDWIDRVEVDTADGPQVLVTCDNAATLAYLANQACVTLHVSLSRRDRLDRPDRLVLDLDPPARDFAPVRDAARRARALLEEIDLRPFLTTTGSRGLHVVLPLDRSADFDAVRAFARDFAAVLAARYPDDLTTEQRKQKRRGRLYLDTGRNAYGQTAVAPYAVRALPGAPACTPLEWSELDDPDLTAQRWTLHNLRRRLAQRDDPWKDIARHARGLDAARARLHELGDADDG